MAKNTSIALRSQVVYSIYVRAHTPEGTFSAVIPDLERIRELGTDIIWLMPVHPVGEVGKKGPMGCPYAIKDYRAVNPEYGTLEDFKALVDAIHAQGMKCIIDVVYNHTSPDSVLSKEHPEFFYRKPDGSFGNRVGEWTDVIDLDYDVPELWDYQIETLVYWAGFVDGFRCDVAPLIPMEFWKKAREAVAKVRPDAIWLAETVDGDFVQMRRLMHLPCATDSEAYEAFDMEYEYDVRKAFDNYLAGKCDLSQYAALLNFQERAYPANYVKLRFLENHDQPRISSRVREETDLFNFTAYLYFAKGATLLYAGQEYREDHLPSLFDKETIRRNEILDISPWLSEFARLKKEELSDEDLMECYADDENNILAVLRDDGKRRKIGIFCFKSTPARLRVPFLNDGKYVNLMNDAETVYTGGIIRTDGLPMILAEIKE